MKSFISFVVITLAASSAISQQANQTLQGQAQQPQVQTTPNNQAAVQAQQTPQQSQQPSFIALRVVGSQVRGTGGAQLGRIEEVLLNPVNGTINFAVIAAGSPASTGRVVPVPWSMLQYAWDQSRAGGPPGANQVFVANLDAQRLAQAPPLDRTRAGMEASLAAASTFFGVPTAVFGTTGDASTTFLGSGTNLTFGTTNQMTVSTNPPPAREFIPGAQPPFTPLQNVLPVPQEPPNNNQNPPTSNPGAGIAPPTGGAGKSGTPVPGAGRPPPSPGTGARPSSGGSAPPAAAPGGTR